MSQSEVMPTRSAIDFMHLILLAITSWAICEIVRFGHFPDMRPIALQVRSTPVFGHRRFWGPGLSLTRIG